MKNKYVLIPLILGLGLVLGLLRALDTKSPAHAAPTLDLEVCPSGCAYSSIQAAVDAANPGDVVKVAQGTYTDVQNVASLNSSAFTATQIVIITQPITLRGGYNDDFSTWDPDVYHTILDAQGQGRAVAITGTITPVVEGLHVTGGDANDLGGNWVDFGSWMWVDHVGGGIYIHAATAVISGNRVYSNTANAGSGLFLFYSDATLSNNTVSSNTTPGGGAGIYLEHSPATLSGNIVSNNESDSWGGGIYVSASSATLNANTICNNTTTSYGGGVALSGSNATLSGNTVCGNTADEGGGLQVYNCDAILSGNVITGNVAELGGGLKLEAGPSTLINNVVADNQATLHGSGIYAYRSTARLLHTTIARNSGGNGAGVHVSDDTFDFSTVAMSNTIIVSHTVGITVTAGNTVTLDATLWYNNSGGNWSGNVIPVPSREYNGDPAFALDGYHILTSSVALDRGVDAGVLTDIDGQTRPQGAGYDLGADELPANPPDVTWDKQIRIGQGAFRPWDDEPFTVKPNDLVTIVERVWVTATGSVSFTLGEAWSPAFEWEGYDVTVGSVSQAGRAATWSAPSAAANAWHGLTKTLRAVAVPGYLGLLTETLRVEGLPLQLPERIVQFKFPRPQAVWIKTVRVNAAAPQQWNAGQFTVSDGDTLAIVDRLWITHTSGVSFTLGESWGAGLALQGQAYDAGVVVTGTGTLTWRGTGEPASVWHTLTTTLRVSGTAWLYESISETLNVEDAATQLSPRTIKLLNLSGVAGCYARVNDGSTTYNTVQAAVDAAQPDDVVKVAGRCTAINERGGLTQIAYISKSLTIQGGYTTTNWSTPDPISNPTTLDALGLGRVLYVSGDVAPTIAGLRITGGDATDLGGMPWGDVGGGIYINAASAIISNNLIYSNTAVDTGGGVFLVNSPASLLNNVIERNSMPSGGSGAGVTVYDSSATLDNNVVRDNHGHDWGGGVLVSGGSPTISANTISGNSVINGGGGLAISSGSNAEIDGNTITGNSAGSAAGVWVYFSTPLLSNNIISGNVAAAAGGGLGLEGDSPTLVNNVVINNRTSGMGAGLYLIRSAARLLHTTIAHNSGGDGAGVHVSDRNPEYSSVAMTNTIIAGHGVGITVTAGNAVRLNATLWHANSVTDTGGAGTINRANDRSGDPVFGPDGYHLGSTSLALGLGVNVGVDDDVDGQTRPQDGGYDAGADEFVCVALDGVSVSGPTEGVGGTVYTFVATVVPGDASLPITYTWSPPPLPSPVLLSWQSSVTATWGTSGDYTVTVMAVNCGASGTDSHTITVSADRFIYLPVVLRGL